MDIRPIKSEADYDAALVEIDRLMGASRDTPDGDKLELLMTLVHAYEDAQWPINDPCGHQLCDTPSPDTS